MTTPYERTKAVIETREFLKLLASSDGVASRRWSGPTYLRTRGLS
ncbi:BPSL0761 family protein [Burkholderia cenocepacia]|nr:BPSL0761 family protein [Burkholderia cenocepacia]